ncbi:MAG: CARDB domain-containing protein [Candidatus Aenigmatarchaeota archaeon]
MMKKLIFALITCLIISQSFIELSSSIPVTRRKLIITLPLEVEGFSGEEVIVSGKIYSKGTWMRKVFVYVEGLPFVYTIEPNYFDAIALNKPSEFKIKIKIPDNLEEEKVYLVTVKAQETYTAYAVEGKSTFKLKAKPKAEFSLSRILYPQEIIQNQSFSLNVTVENSGNKEEVANIFLKVPEGWNYEDGITSVKLKPGEASTLSFNITPSNTTGSVSVIIQYPYKDSILNVTKLGPILSPISPEVKKPEEAETITDYLATIQEISPILKILSILFLAIIIWNVYSMYKTSSVRKKEETMKKGETA